MSGLIINIQQNKNGIFIQQKRKKKKRGRITFMTDRHVKLGVPLSKDVIYE